MALSPESMRELALAFAFHELQQIEEIFLNLNALGIQGVFCGEGEGVYARSAVVFRAKVAVFLPFDVNDFRLRFEMLEIVKFVGFMISFCSLRASG